MLEVEHGYRAGAMRAALRARLGLPEPTGEWLRSGRRNALVLQGARGGAEGAIGDALCDEVMHPTAHRLLQHGDGVLRLPGASTGADNDVRIAEERGLPVWGSVEEIPSTGAEVA